MYEIEGGGDLATAQSSSFKQRKRNIEYFYLLFNHAGFDGKEHLEHPDRGKTKLFTMPQYFKNEFRGGNYVGDFLCIHKFYDLILKSHATA